MEVGRLTHKVTLFYFPGNLCQRMTPRAVASTVCNETYLGINSMNTSNVYNKKYKIKHLNVTRNYILQKWIFASNFVKMNKVCLKCTNCLCLNNLNPICFIFLNIHRSASKQREICMCFKINVL